MWWNVWSDLLCPLPVCCICCQLSTCVDCSRADLTSESGVHHIAASHKRHSAVPTSDESLRLLAADAEQASCCCYLLGLCQQTVEQLMRAQPGNGQRALYGEVLASLLTSFTCRWRWSSRWRCGRRHWPGRQLPGGRQRQHLRCRCQGQEVEYSHHQLGRQLPGARQRQHLSCQ